MIFPESSILPVMAFKATISLSSGSSGVESYLEAKLRTQYTRLLGCCFPSVLSGWTGTVQLFGPVHVDIYVYFPVRLSILNPESLLPRSTTRLRLIFFSH